MWVQACTRGSRSSQALGKDCFGPKRPGPKEEKDADTSWQLSALQPVRTVLSFHCPRLGGQRCSLCSGPEKTAFARKHRQDLQSSWPAIGVPAKLCYCSHLGFISGSPCREFVCWDLSYSWIHSFLRPLSHRLLSCE